MSALPITLESLWLPHAGTAGREPEGGVVRRQRANKNGGGLQTRPPFYSRAGSSYGPSENAQNTRIHAGWCGTRACVGTPSRCTVLTEHS